MSPAQNELNRAVQILLDARQDRRHAQAALVAAQHAEDQAHVTLKHALDLVKLDSTAAVVLPDFSERRVFGSPALDSFPSRASFTSDTAQAILSDFNGVRD